MLYTYHDLKTIGYVLFLLTQFLLTRVIPNSQKSL